MANKATLLNTLSKKQELENLELGLTQTIKTLKDVNKTDQEIDEHKAVINLRTKIEALKKESVKDKKK